MPRGWNLAGVLVGKGIFFTWAIVIPLLVYPVVGCGRRLPRLRDDHQPDHGNDFSTRALCRGGHIHLSGAGDATRPVWAVHEVEIDRRLLPAQPRADLGVGRPQLPDRAPPVPAPAAYALPPRSPRSCGATAPSTEFAIRHNHPYEPHCARTSCTSAQWADWEYPPRSRWANRSPDGRSLDVGFVGQGRASVSASSTWACLRGSAGDDLVNSPVNCSGCATCCSVRWKREFIPSRYIT